MYVLHVGHAYSRSTMQGLLCFNGIEGQSRIAAALRHVAPLNIVPGELTLTVC